MAKITHDELVKHANDKYVASKNWREVEIEKRWLDDTDAYNSKFPRLKNGKSNVLANTNKLFIPKSYSHTQRMLVDILDAFFFDRTEIFDVGEKKGVPDEIRLAVKAVINHRLNGNPINFYQQSLEACLDSLKCKVGIFKIYPEFKIKHVVLKDGEGNVEREEDVVIGYEPRIDCVPYEDVFFDAEATWIDYYKFTIVHRMRKTVDYLKRKKYLNLEQLKGMTGEDPAGTDAVKQQRAEDTGSPFQTGWDQLIDKTGSVLVYEVWTKLDIDGDGFLEDVSFLCAGDMSGPKFILREAEENQLPYNGRPPFAVGQAFPEPHMMYGKSLVEVVEGLQRETNALRNQRREATALRLRSPLLVQRGSGLDLVGLINRRIGGLVIGDDIGPDAVRQLETSDPGHDSVIEQKQTDEDFYETTSIPPALSGMPTKGRETATGVSSKVQNANKKIAQAVRNLAYTLFLPAAEMLLRLEQAYETDAYINKVTGQKIGWEFINAINPASDQIQGDFELTINLGVNKQQELQKWLMLLEKATIVNQTVQAMVQAGVVDPSQVHYVNTMEIFHQVFPLLGVKDREKFMIGAQQPPAELGPGKGIASQTAGSENQELSPLGIGAQTLQ